jgi:hypothetical protein
VGQGGTAHAQQMTCDAFARARTNRVDFSEFAEEMTFVACGLVPTGDLTVDRYIQILYCAAKFSGLGRYARSFRTKKPETIQ